MATEGDVASSSYHYPTLQAPSWSASSSEPLIRDIVYKGTRTGLVVKRRVALFADRCKTYHDPTKDKDEDATTWMLDRNCSLIPQTAEELGPQKRGIRPRGTWAITAAVQGVTEYAELYELTIDWPPSWAASGYTTLTLAFKERDDAKRWHKAFTDVLEGLRKAKGHSRHNSSKNASELSTTSVPVARSATDSLAAVSAAASDGRAQSFKAASQDRVVEIFAAAAATHAAEAAAGGDEAWTDAESDAEEGFSDSDSDDDPSAPPTPDEERWVPYRQTNGVAIYRYAADDKKCDGGGEYMVSCVIRGRPHRVAAALMRLRGNTTILGPAAHAEVLQPAGEAAAGGGAGVGKEILRLVLTASGQTGFFCAPREIILERVRKDEEDGVTVIMFKSVDLPNETTSKGRGNAYGSGLFKRPVRGSVAGGYTIAGLRGEGAASRESLITCIVKVDLGGACGGGSWLRPLSALVGWTDSFLERILMSVTLVRDKVEQRRFSVQPFALVASAKARFNEDGTLQGVRASARSQLRASAGGAAAAGSSSAARAAPARSASFARPLGRMASMRPGAEPGEARALSTGGVEPVEEEGAPASEGTSVGASAAAPRLDLQRLRSLALMPRKYWAEIHLPGTDAPFSVRGPTYLKDKKKVPAGQAAFSLGSVDMIVLPPPGTRVAGTPDGTSGVVEHVARFVPSIRQGGAPFSIIIHLVIPGSPMLGLVAVFCCDKHPSILGKPPANPMDEPHDWQPFDFVLHKFVYGDDATRNAMLKLIPHIAAGSWMIKQSVGTTPVILGKALKTTYHCTPSYIEIDIDISANSVANYVTGMVRGATSSLVVDMAFVLEGSAPWELPECLLGCFRLTRLDCKDACRPLDWSKELPAAAAGGAKL